VDQGRAAHAAVAVGQGASNYDAQREHHREQVCGRCSGDSPDQPVFRGDQFRARATALLPALNYVNSIDEASCAPGAPWQQISRPSQGSRKYAIGKASFFRMGHAFQMVHWLALVALVITSMLFGAALGVVRASLT